LQTSDKPSRAGKGKQKTKKAAMTLKEQDGSVPTQRCSSAGGLPAQRCSSAGAVKTDMSPGGVCGINPEPDQQLNDILNGHHELSNSGKFNF